MFHIIALSTETFFSPGIQKATSPVEARHWDGSKCFSSSCLRNAARKPWRHIQQWNGEKNTGWNPELLGKGPGWHLDSRKASELAKLGKLDHFQTWNILKGNSSNIHHLFLFGRFFFLWRNLSTKMPFQNMELVLMESMFNFYINQPTIVETSLSRYCIANKSLPLRR